MRLRVPCHIQLCVVTHTVVDLSCLLCHSAWLISLILRCVVSLCCSIRFFLLNDFCFQLNVFGFCVQDVSCLLGCTQLNSRRVIVHAESKHVLLYAVKCIKNTSAYFAERLYKAMKVRHMLLSVDEMYGLQTDSDLMTYHVYLCQT